MALTGTSLPTETLQTFVPSNWATLACKKCGGALGHVRTWRMPMAMNATTEMEFERFACSMCEVYYDFRSAAFDEEKT